MEITPEVSLGYIFEGNGRMNQERDRMLYWIAFREGEQFARRRCDVCPARVEDGQPALITARDLLLRNGIEN